MRILFCNIAWMDYYKGIWLGIDEPVGGGSYVMEYRDAHEKNNFNSITVNEDDGSTSQVCCGFVETKTSRSGKRQELHIEKIEGCSSCKKEEAVEDVLVVYCAARPYQNFTSVVGWYRHATVYRYYQEMVLSFESGEEYHQFFNAEARKENCVLLPRQERRITKWNVPRRQTGASYGFGQANVWFAEGREKNPLLDQFLKDMMWKIDEYDGENWIDQFPENRE